MGPHLWLDIARRLAVHIRIKQCERIRDQVDGLGAPLAHADARTQRRLLQLKLLLPLLILIVCHLLALALKHLLLLLPGLAFGLALHSRPLRLLQLAQLLLPPAFQGIVGDGRLTVHLHILLDLLTPHELF
jgi:uncharacterized membrane protein